MFDVYTQASPYPQNIHEHRAPTDDSLRLLRDIEQDANRRVLAAFSFKNNAVMGSVIRFMDHCENEEKIVCSFKINGKSHIVTQRVDVMSFNMDRSSAFPLLVNAVAMKLAELILTTEEQP